MMLGMINGALRDSSLSVQVAAAWALANLADAITGRGLRPEPECCARIAESEQPL